MKRDVIHYRSNETGERVEAVSVPENTSMLYMNMEGFRVRADGGQYLIVHPYHEAVDPESFEREYKPQDE